MTKKIKVVLTCFKQTSYEDYTHFFKTVEIEVPCQEGEDWHDLRKDPNDLPKDNKHEYLVILDFLGRKYELLRLCEIKVYKKAVIKWCEIL